MIERALFLVRFVVAQVILDALQSRLHLRISEVRLSAHNAPPDGALTGRCDAGAETALHIVREHLQACALVGDLLPEILGEALGLVVRVVGRFGALRTPTVIGLAGKRIHNDERLGESLLRLRQKIEVVLEDRRVGGRLIQESRRHRSAVKSLAGALTLHAGFKTLDVLLDLHPAERVVVVDGADARGMEEDE